MCVSVCLSVCPTWDMRNGRLYRHAAYSILKSFNWWVAQTAFWAYTMHHSREKAFGSFLPVRLRIPLHAPLHFWLPWAGSILSTTWPPLEHSQRSHVEGHAHFITDTIVAITDIWQSMYTGLNDPRFEWKRLWKFFTSDELNSMHARYISRLPRTGWIFPTTWTPLEHSRRLHV